MGPVPKIEISNISMPESFENQFNLQTNDNIGVPASIGDGWESNNKTNILKYDQFYAIASNISGSIKNSK